MKEKLNVLLENLNVLLEYSSAKKACILTVVLAVPLSGLLYFILDTYYNSSHLFLLFWVYSIIMSFTYILVVITFFICAYVVFLDKETREKIRSFVLNHFSTENWIEIEIDPEYIKDYPLFTTNGEINATDRNKFDMVILFSFVKLNNAKLFAKLNGENEIVVYMVYPDRFRAEELTTDIFSFYDKFKFKD